MAKVKIEQMVKHDIIFFGVDQNKCMMFEELWHEFNLKIIVQV
jgi:hypothetical protein